MSTATKRIATEALADAVALRALFEGAYERWEFAGSLRRQKPEVSDVEHVIIARFGDAPIAGSMFAEMATANLLMARCDELLAVGKIAKHEYAVNYADGRRGTRNMWGDTYRGLDFKGYMHELFCATEDNWGSILCIRTGPADFSERMVTQLKRGPLHQSSGFVKYQKDGRVFPVRTEEAFLTACGQRWLEPKDRR